ncbi:MAG: TIGR03936 family radical SAM-associated protein [Bacillota bacterium]|jgi:radical SAM-linked protein
MKTRVCYEIIGPLAFLSHLEIMRLWQRASLRAGLPIAWSNGFNPRPKISLGPARNVGVEGHREYLDMEFREEIAGDDVKERLNAILPEGIRVLSLRPLPPGTKMLEAVINEAHYQITFGGGAPPDLKEKIASFLAAEHCPYLRESPKGKKELDLRSYVLAIDVGESGFALAVRAGQGGSLRVAELLTVLGYWDIIEDIKIERTGLFVSEGTERTAP